MQSFRIKSVVAFLVLSVLAVAQTKGGTGRAGSFVPPPDFAFPGFARIHAMPVYRVGMSSVTSPRLLPKPNESLPPGAEGRTLPLPQGGYIGTTSIWAVIDSHGNVRYPRIIRGLSDDENKRALDEVKTWKFAPAVRLGDKVAVQVNLTVKFE